MGLGWDVWGLGVRQEEEEEEEEGEGKTYVIFLTWLVVCFGWLGGKSRGYLAPLRVELS